MAWPTNQVPTTHLDSTSDDPSLAVADLKAAVDALNQMMTHVSLFMRGMLDDADADAALTTLGASSLGKALIAAANDAAARTALGLGNVSTIGTNGSTSNFLRGDGQWAGLPSSAPTTAQVLNATAGASAGGVGTYAFLRRTSSSGSGPGTTQSGSGLRYSDSM